jgi:lipoprotein-anchoring transpeptidase ErfK/SrfK
VALVSLIGAGCSHTEPQPAPAASLNLEALEGGFEGAQRAIGSEEWSRAQASSAAQPSSAATPVQEVPREGPLLAATRLATIVYKRPHTDSARLGYLRLGAVVPRDEQPTSGSGCKGKWFAVKPVGFVCTDDATIDLSDPLVRATSVRPARDQPLPYRYGFVRATAPQYLRLPTHDEQLKSEFKLDEHLAWYQEHFHEVQRVILGANDIPLGERGFARLGLTHPAGTRLSTQLSPIELFGADKPRGEIPFWLKEGRLIPNVSDFQVPEYALFADRVRRKTGLSFIDAFIAESQGVSRGFAVTVDMRLIPTTKIKPDTASPFHGVELTPELQPPFAFVLGRSATSWKLLKGKDEAAVDAHVPQRSIVPLSGHVRVKAGQRFYQTARLKTAWLRAQDISVVAPPLSLPVEAQQGQRWIDVSLAQQTLVLYEGTRPIYATLVSTGKDRLGDPKTTQATPQGTFRIQSKHTAAAMDSEENSTVSGGTKAFRSLSLDGDAAATAARLLEAERAGKRLNAEDQRRLLNVKKGRHPEYGVTMRRGSGGYELRDVPYIQYFAAGYALHGAYWHDVFGTPRSHGCINLAPIDARVVFQFTEPSVPSGWHGINVSEEFGTGTLVSVRE